ncbi:hypothetical protein M885DRAFT_31516 [Pelagophyceae sp. CCMP2097]|nr:hypothetical protein M885DRAFT_31516 [Pelagophyceae sp. CCMP2097]
MVQHTVLFKLEGVARGGDVETALLAVVAKFNTLSGICCSFSSHGTADKEKVAALAALDWADRTDGFTHCLMVIADDAEALKGYLHHAYHVVDWIAAVSPYQKGVVVFDSALAIDLDQAKFAQLHPVLFRLAVVVYSFNTLDGISASVMPHLGAAFLAAVDWKDTTVGFTYCLTVAARDEAALKVYLHSAEHASWVPVVRPHFDASLGPPTVVFDVPLQLTVAM